MYKGRVPRGVRVINALSREMVAMRVPALPVGAASAPVLLKETVSDGERASCSAGPPSHRRSHRQLRPSARPAVPKPGAAPGRRD